MMSANSLSPAACSALLSVCPAQQKLQRKARAAVLAIAAVMHPPAPSTMERVIVRSCPRWLSVQLPCEPSLMPCKV